MFVSFSVYLFPRFQVAWTNDVDTWNDDRSVKKQQLFLPQSNT